MRSVRLILSLLFVAGTLNAATDYIGRTDVKDSFDIAFGKTSWRTWTDGGTVLRSLIGQTFAIVGARQNSQAVPAKLWSYLGLSAASQLRADDARSYHREDEAHYEYLQLSPDGRPVENTSVVIDVNRFDQIVGVVNQAAKGLGLLKTAPLLSPDAAKCFAVADFLGKPMNCDLPGLTLSDDQKALVPGVPASILYAVAPFAREAWALELLSPKALTVRRYVIDARGGFILEKRDRVYHLDDPHGFVFNPSPLIEHGVKSISDIKFPEPPYERESLTNLNTVNAAGERRLTGLFVTVVDRDNNQNLHDDITSRNDKFEFERGVDGGLASVMAYYHIDAMQQYIQNTLHLNDVAARQIEVDIRGEPFNLVDGTIYTNNASGTGVLTFGYRDDGKPIFIAEDGDVIAHEYGHALQASLAKDHYDKMSVKQTRAMAEGFADYWALSYFAAKKPAYAPHLLPVICFGAWAKSADGVSGCMRGIRPATTMSSFSEAAGDYANAEVWTATLLALRSAFPQQPGIADRMILRSHLSVHDGPDFVEGFRAIITADALQNAGADHHALLCSIFTERGIIKPEECKTPPSGNDGAK